MKVPAEPLTLERIMELAHRQVGLDVAYVAELCAEKLVYRAVTGDAASFNVVVGESQSAHGSYGERLVAGEIPSVIADVAADVRVAELPMTRTARVGAFVGVPVRLTDGTLFGTLCCLGREPIETLDASDAWLLTILAELMAPALEAFRGREEFRGDLQQLIDRDGLELAYQPLFDLRRERCAGLEALARFPEPFAGPEQTFAAAHEVGLGVELERVVARHALRMVPRLGAGQFVAVNVTPRALLELAGLAQREEVPLSRVVVEVTEPSAVEAYAVLRRELAPLRERGLRIAVDDAGAGYASLRHVLELRPDFIKLDRWLIDGLADDPARRVAVSAFVSLARELHARVVAEGVEREPDLRVLGELGVDIAQGYLLARPTTDQRAISGWLEVKKSSERRDGGRDSADERSAAYSEAAAAGAVALAAGPSRNSDPAGGPQSASGLGEAVEPPTVDAVAEEPGRAAVAQQLERLELDRRVSQRLEAVGQLAAGIAHEINTPLQFVGDSVTFLKDAVDELVALTGLYRETLYSEAAVPVEERRRMMREAEERADVEYLCERIPPAFARTADGIARVRSIVQAMKRFSHASVLEAAPADLNEALESTLVVCRNEYKYVANVVLELGELPEVTCNIGELNQVFLNMIVNAAQAIEAAVGDTGQQGQIRISTRVEGNDAVIEIADDGPGIPPALLDRIYEPFFTTKEVGKGTGQGLALARATIERHAGSLECVSELGEGTTFRIRLPVQRQPAEMATAV